MGRAPQWGSLADRMKDPSLRSWIFGSAAALLLLAALAAVFWPRAADPRTSSQPADQAARTAGTDSHGDAASKAGLAAQESSASPLVTELATAYSGVGVIPNEAILRFKSDAAYDAFLRRTRARGLTVVDSMKGSRALRVRFGRGSDLVRDIEENEADYEQVGPNFLVQAPDLPVTEERAEQSERSFGNQALDWIGAGDRDQWGQGVTVAVIDSGIAPHSTFLDDRIQRIDFTEGEIGFYDNADGHGTAVASILAGEHPQAPGVAPASELLSYRITDASGASDSFTLAKAINAASEGGADVINVSLGSYGDSPLVLEAVERAYSNGTVVVAAAGNETYSEVAYPARYENVVAVGGVDAAGQQLSFSNSGQALDLAAPGLEVNAAWPQEQLISMSGTSASAPFVAGAIAAVMSERPGTSAVEAAELLRANSNEAGAPGFDPAYGNGVLNVERALRADQPGVYDVAVASNHFDPSYREESGASAVQVVVENRGTETLSNIPLSVQSETTRRDYLISSLEPGAIAVRDFPFPGAEGDLTSSTALASGSLEVDANSANNQRSTTISSGPDSP